MNMRHPSVDLEGLIAFIIPMMRLVICCWFWQYASAGKPKAVKAKDLWYLE